MNKQVITRPISDYEAGVRLCAQLLKFKTDEVLALLATKQYRKAVDEASDAIEKAEDMFRFVVDCQQVDQFGSPARKEYYARKKGDSK